MDGVTNRKQGQNINKVGRGEKARESRKRKRWTDGELKLAVCIIWGPVGYHSVWIHKAELALLCIGCSHSAERELHFY